MELKVEEEWDSHMCLAGLCGSLSRCLNDPPSFLHPTQPGAGVLKAKWTNRELLPGDSSFHFLGGV